MDTTPGTTGGTGDTDMEDTTHMVIFNKKIMFKSNIKLYLINRRIQVRKIKMLCRASVG